MSKPRKPVPDFAGEAEERAFRETHDTADYVDWSMARPVRLPNLKPSTTAISLRLPVALLERIKLAANQRDVPYQSLIKLWLAEKVEANNRRTGKEFSSETLSASMQKTSNSLWSLIPDTKVGLPASWQLI